jgi:cell division protein FtsB
MQLSTLLLILTGFIFLFSFIVRNINYATSVLNIDTAKLKQSISYLEDRNKRLTNMDLLKLELN